MSAKILITGATGFIGGHLAVVLTNSGYDVRAAVRGSDRTLPPPIEVMPDFSLTTRSQLRDAVAGVRCVVHLAGRVHVTNRIDQGERIRYDQTNVDGTLALAREAANAGVRRFIFISTIAVNGQSTEPGRPFTEYDDPVVQHPYAHSKLEAERRLIALAAATGMDVVRIRPPLVYGPGVKANFRTMMDWVQKGTPLPFGSVTQNRRTLVGVDNLNDLIRTCIDHPGAANRLFLAGDGEDLSTADLLHRLAQAMGKPLRLVRVPTRLLEALFGMVGMSSTAQRLLRSLQVDTSKARRLLDWAPPISVDEGFRRTAADRFAPD